MPQFLVLAMIVSTVIIEFLAETGVLPRVIGFLPEALGGFALLYVIVEGRKSRFRNVAPIYWVVFGALALHMVSGLLISVDRPGPIIMGLRYYLRALPFFLLPAVFAFTSRQIDGQMRLLLVLALIQLPVALYQSMQPDVTGDGIVGTLQLNQFFSPFLVCCVCVACGYLLKGQLRIWPFILIVLVIMTPAAINETKVTFILFPVAVLSVFLLGSDPGHRLRNMFRALVVTVAGVAALVSVYSYTQRDVAEAIDLHEFVFEGGYKDYLDNDGGFGTVEDENQYIGRANALMVPVEFVLEDPIRAWFGLGIGNASRSPLGDEFQGEYGMLFEDFMSTAAVRFILEIGFGGVLGVLLLLVLVLRDSMFVSHLSEAANLRAIAAGWVGVSVGWVVITLYADTAVSSALGYLYWYLSGLVAAERMRVLHAAAETARTTLQRPERTVSRLARAPRHVRASS